MHIRLDPGRCLKALFRVIAVLSLIHLATISVWDLLEGKVGTHFILRVFHFQFEANIPTYFSSLQLLGSGIALLVITARCRAQNDPWLGWAGLAATFCFLSLDEFVQIHELFEKPMRQLMGRHDLLYNAWVIPYGFAMLLFCFFYLRFFLQLPNASKRRVIVAAALLVGGALGIETLTAVMYKSNGETIARQLANTCEELFEMTGGALFLHAWLCYLDERFTYAELVVGEDTAGRSTHQQS